MKDVLDKHNFEIITTHDQFDIDINLNSSDNGVFIYKLCLSSSEAVIPKSIQIKWKHKAINVNGIWKPTSDYDKRIKADWELNPMMSRISIDSPLMAIFGHDDSNVLTFSCSDAINTLLLDTLYREEDNHFYSCITFFPEKHHPIATYEAYIRIDERNIHFSKTIQDVSKWWETFDYLTPLTTPKLAKTPVYSTWYNFHQELKPDELFQELKLAKKMGYGLVILDDGWQTDDSNRGYDFTGDWVPERFPEMENFVQDIHNLNMKIALWYSVPFCGKKSKAYKHFKGKFLTENHRWAPVFDPRYPEVRSYLINLYKNALLKWKVDGFKLDFIDEFRTYSDTELTLDNGRDYSSVNEAVDRLMTDVIKTLHAVNPHCIIEFRQKYVGPAMRKFGNMFRAFDCPGDATMNRVRITDLRLTSGTTAIHGDMFTYHPDERLEQKAFYLLNSFFGVPQLSIKLLEAGSDELSMIQFYTDYWNKNKHILLDGTFTPFYPLSNYPICRAAGISKEIFAIYSNVVIPFNTKRDKIDIINAQLKNYIILESNSPTTTYTVSIFNLLGKLENSFTIAIKKGITKIDVPYCGLVHMLKVI